MANELQVRITESANFGSLTIGGTVGVVSANNLVTFRQTLPASTTVLLEIPTFDVADVLVAAMEADQACTVKTNSSGSPDDTVTMAAKRPLVWRSGYPDPFFFDGSSVSGEEGLVKKLYVVTGSTETLFTLGLGLDATPTVSE